MFEFGKNEYNYVVLVGVVVVVKIKLIIKEEVLKDVFRFVFVVLNDIFFSELIDVFCFSLLCVDSL